MTRFLLALIFICSGCSTPVFQDFQLPIKHSPPSPAIKSNLEATGRHIDLASMSPMLPRVAMAPTEETNSVFYLPLSWNYSNPVQTFRLHIGRKSHVYDTFVDIGTNTFFELWKTNWVEESDRHFFAVTAVDALGHESEYSNEVHWPPYPDDHYTISWLNPAPATLIATTDISSPKSSWSIITRTASGTTNYTSAMPLPYLFFSLYRTNGNADMMFVKTFNPLN